MADDASDTGSGATPDALTAALDAAAAQPERVELWDALDQLAGTLARPDDVAALLDRVLARDELDPALADALGQRAVALNDEWFQDPDALARTLARVLERAPFAEWAFHRITLVLTAAARWNDLL